MLNRSTASFFKIILAVMLSLIPPSLWAKQAHIAIVADGLTEIANQNLTLLKAEISELLEGEYDIQYHDGATYDGRWSLERIEGIFKATQSNDSIDLVIAYGPLASHVAINTESLNKPTIATLFLDSDLQSVPREG
ncbi:MAG: hypothetical protein MI867_18110, partial [Pseudomonadales bacterium]|nr:hypothetical protein [Pseudomonadales bacterium]